MIDRRCVVQFLHPGGEPDLDAPGELPWNTGKLHKRKFLLSAGDYRTAIDGPSQRSERLGFWGEWEPQSVVSRAIRTESGAPHWAHEPFFTSLPSDQWAQNTDPFVFGEQFHFTGCQQHARGYPTQLARLQPGSVVLFGSGKKYPSRFLLDTVLVVGTRAIDHNADNQLRVLDGEISRSYREITIDRWYAAPVPASQTHRLYFGATPEAPVAGMFSFFPCRVLESGGAFPRPVIELREYVTQSQTQKYKKSVVSESEAAGVWRDVAAQVLAAGLQLGVHADIPRRADTAESVAKVAAVRC